MNYNYIAAIFEYSSRLSMSLRSILADPNCLSHFVQYLEHKNALALLKFYLDTENFRKAAISQLQKEQQLQLQASSLTLAGGVAGDKQQAVCDEYKQSQVEQQVTIAEQDENQVPELKNLCDLSMRKPLTDDEKSQIYAETNKRLEFNRKFSGKCKYASTVSLSSMTSNATGHELDGAVVSAASVKDALIIYQKYLGNEAALKVSKSFLNK